MPDENTKVDKTPDGSPPRLPSGEAQYEYGIIDTQETFPAKNYEWNPEFDNPEKHLIVPVQVVKRGYSSLRLARNRAQEMNEELGEKRYHAVPLSDPRGV